MSTPHVNRYTDGFWLAGVSVGEKKGLGASLYTVYMAVHIGARGAPCCRFGGLHHGGAAPPGAARVALQVRRAAPEAGRGGAVANEEEKEAD